jgi:hypothetical protein
MNTNDAEADDVRESAVYWFTILEIAVEAGDHATAADAQRELFRLGVEVRYGTRLRKVVADAR